MNTTISDTSVKGGEWLIKEYNANDTFTPEDFSEEQLMILDMCLQFLKTEIYPIVDRIDKLEPGLMPSLMEKAGELGLLSASVPENLGGLGKDFVTPSSASFNVRFATSIVFCSRFFASLVRKIRLLLLSFFEAIRFTNLDFSRLSTSLVMLGLSLKVASHNCCWLWPSCFHK